MPSLARRLATLDDLARAEAEGRACEIVDGELVEKSMGDEGHGTAHAAVTAAYFGPFNRRQGGGGPGGWWIKLEVDILFAAEQVLRPDIAGWRRESLPSFPAGWPTRVRPDWICEILSPTTAKRDLGPKRKVYQQAGVTHYWVVDRTHEVIDVYRLVDGWYRWVLTAAGHETVGIEPFDEVPLFVGSLFGVEPEDLPTSRDRDRDLERFLSAEEVAARLSVVERYIRILGHVAAQNATFERVLELNVHPKRVRFGRSRSGVERPDEADTARSIPGSELWAQTHSSTAEKAATLRNVLALFGYSEGARDRAVAALSRR